MDVYMLKIVLVFMMDAMNVRKDFLIMVIFVIKTNF